MLHIPLLRAGRPYHSLRQSALHHVSTGEPVATVSQANQGIISRDRRQGRDHQKELSNLSVADLTAICKRAAVLFGDETLPLFTGADDTQTPDEYVASLSATTGLPFTLCRANMAKIHHVLSEMDGVLDGLTRGMDPAIIDIGWGTQDGRTLSYQRQTNALGAVLPSNSPGVHSLWLPAIPLKVPVVLKPGGEEPWTPYRIAAAFVAAGCPPEAFSLYPTDYGGATQILLTCERSMLFGGGDTVAPWRQDPRVEVHGPGRSKILLGDDEARRWESHLDLVCDSVSANGGRSCINASSVWTTSQGRDLAVALAQRLARIEPTSLDDPAARLAAFSNPQTATRISTAIDRLLATAGAEDLTAPLYGERLVRIDGCVFLRPTVIWCDDPDHPLANTEYLFPFVSVVELPQAQIPRTVGPSLVVTALSEEAEFQAALMESTEIDRLNLGSIPTYSVSWDQPHEGNLFEHLYRQRSFAAVSA